MKSFALIDWHYTIEAHHIHSATPCRMFYSGIEADNPDDEGGLLIHPVILSLN